MQLDEFLHDLHFNIDEVRPVEMHVDWDDAPLPFKVYQDVHAVTLSPEVSLPLKTDGPKQRHGVSLKDIADFLWYSYGLTQLCQLMLPSEDGEPDFQVMQMLRRFVPSGGGLYPSELYAYLKIDGLDAGIYHYDVAQHRLVLLRAGDFDDYLERALGHRCDISSCFGTLFVSTMFWKNFFKYHYFSYRLQGLDAGALIGQLLETAKQLGYSAFVFFQFLDQSLNHLLGLRTEEETVYAVMPLRLGERVIIQHDGPTTSGQTENAEVLCRELAQLNHRYYMKSKIVSGYPMITQINDTSMQNSTRQFIAPESIQVRPAPIDGDVIALPNTGVEGVDFTVACYRRYSPGLEFVPHRITLSEVSALFRQTTVSCRSYNDLDWTSQRGESRIAIAACVHGIEGLEDGAYIYDAAVHGLRMLARGDHRQLLQLGMSMPNVNLYQVPVCLHLVGDDDFYQAALGFRGYRIQQMEVGMMLQHLLLSASALGMNGHPLLGYDEQACDDLYNLKPRGKTCLIQVPVGYYRKMSRFDGPMHG